MQLSRLTPCFTYSLGKGLYVPLTSRCNSLTLPETRGPEFLLPTDVVAALCRVRDVENGTDQWTQWIESSLGSNISHLKMPEAISRIHTISSNSDGHEASLPLIHDLIEEIESRLNDQSSNIEAIILAGEGEPTMRLNDLLDLVEEIRVRCKLPVRLTTNGLVTSDDVAKRLAESGVSKVSVALMTAEPKQYDDLMQPLPDNAHARVCSFIKEVIQADLHLEITAVDRHDVDKEKLENLSRSLGVASPIRWRPYFDYT